VYCFSKEGRGATYALEGEKALLLSSRGYLLVTSVDRTNAHSVTVYDLRNKLVAFSGNVGSVRFAVSEWACFLLVGHDGRVHRLSEKDTAQKLDLLYKRNAYQVCCLC
jgi:hypothetical protein